MHFLRTIGLAGLVASASAYTVLTPTLNATVTKGSTLDIHYGTVDTDASTFSVYLVNFQTAHWPPTVLSLAQNVPQGSSANASSVSVRIPCDVSSDYGWQLNFINGTNTYVIYAQSQVFSLTGDCVDPTSSSTSAVAASTSAAAYATTVAANGTVVTSTATVYQAVQTVVYESPVVWFVQPSAVLAGGATCPTVAQQTVTVYANGPAPTCAGSSVGKVVAASSASPLGAASTGISFTSAAKNGTQYPAAAGTGVSPKPSTTGSSAAMFTGAAAAVTVRGAALGVVAGAVALLL